VYSNDMCCVLWCVGVAARIWKETSCFSITLVCMCKLCVWRGGMYKRKEKKNGKANHNLQKSSLINSALQMTTFEWN
jgi:hypothetical protein